MRVKVLKVCAVLISIVAVISAVPAVAGEGEVSVLLGGTFFDGDITGESKFNHVNETYGVRGAYLWGDRFGWFADYTMTDVEFAHSGGFSFDLDELRTGMEFFIHPAERRYRTFVAAGVGLMDMDFGFDSVDRTLASLGIGGRWEIGDHGRARWEIRAEQSLDDDGLGGVDLTNIQALFGLGWGSGGDPADTDGDGVRDRKDNCPDTPRGATVDENGCPRDSDGDGVMDGIDKCPDTPDGAMVDAKGCPVDGDGDGVFDGLDKCPDTPRGATVDAKGCPKDSDGDGVLDGIDKCPDTPKGVKVDAKGCRVDVDSDGDGVVDRLDKCPNTPKGVKVDATGCPLAKKLFQEEKASLVLEGVNFETNSAVLTAGSTAVLNKVVASLKAWPNVRVEVAGHTDSVGRAAYNKTLSEKRAESVRAFLAAAGIGGSRLEANGYGEEMPIADNSTKAGKAANRRVELKKLN